MPKTFAIFIQVIVLTVVFSLDTAAQSTRVRGRIIDAMTGEAIPSAGVYFKNSTIGVTSDSDGWYAIETMADSLTTLSVSCLGYLPEEAEVTPGALNDRYFALRASDNEIDPSMVKAEDENLKRILSRIKSAKVRNNPDRSPHYDCDIYSRAEIDLVNPEAPIVRNLLPRRFHFIYEYVDTALYSGKNYLPVMLSESKSHYYHSRNPEVKKEVIESSRISGISDQKTVAQFTGGLYIKPNFYENYLNIFQMEIPSPISDNGSLFYDYRLVDSLSIDGRKTYRIRFNPSKYASIPAFEGEMSIDSQDYALRAINARLGENSGVNWVKRMSISVDNQRLPDSTWFYKQDNITMELAVTLPGKASDLSFQGGRRVDYSSPSFSESPVLSILDPKAPVLMHSDVLKDDEGYWESVRPFPLTKREQRVYGMVDSVKSVPLYKIAYKATDMFSNGFFNFKYIGLGPYYSTYSFNQLEGTRLQLGFRTTKELSRKVRLMGYGAYGFADQAWKWGFSSEFILKDMPRHKLNVTYKHDMLPLGADSFGFGNGDLVNSILAKKGGRKMSMIDDAAITYQHEWSQGFNMMAGLESRTIYPSVVVPMVSPDGRLYDHLGYDQALLQLRFSKDEVVTRGVFDKRYVFSPYPIVTVNMAAAMQGVGRNEYTFFRPEVKVQYTLMTAPLGSSSINLSAGTVVGKVPYPLLKIYEGNETYRLRSKAFSCMDYYEFASDTWATLFWEHDFKGFFLGKIPLVKKLKLREIAIFRAAYGTLRDENNGILGDPGFGSDMVFPVGMNKLDTPYVEAGVGIANIFKFLRVDGIWRLTHRTRVIDGEAVPHPNRFVVNIGFKFNL